ncbi:MAG TPA: hypothetical protein DGT23_03540 [Micromonosporaceae bacterium]|nr:hypothetical protein [Micromonosporaceae bacterium]
MDELMRSRWRGQAGRAEVWYTTITDTATGTGIWLHHELIAPLSGEPAYAHGFAGIFPVDAPPVLARFGPAPWLNPSVFACGDVTMTTSTFTGTAGNVSWDLMSKDGSAPMYTFPRWAWRSGLLPGAQIVPAPNAMHHGTVRFGDRTLILSDAPGATGRIYGHGMARKWAWLHADLGGGDVLEIVAAVAKRAGWRRLPVLPFVRLRLNGNDWPAGDPLLAAMRFRATIDLPEWTVSGRGLRVVVRQPAERSLAVPFKDPDGSPIICHNSERADADIELKLPDGTHRRWELRGTAHAEVGLR